MGFDVDVARYRICEIQTACPLKIEAFDALIPSLKMKTF